MALTFLIDGYNLLYALPDLPPGTWEAKRVHLIELLKQRRPQGNNALTIVFDSHQGMGDRYQAAGFTVLFTAGETADERIAAIVREAANPRILVVVSNDRGIRNQIKGTGARFISCAEFMKGHPGRPGKPSQASEIPPEAGDITEEFKKKWL
jgi:predicted RNA-binding protein with PIN domain